ncbi:DJ-1/PfpI family protein [Saccharothrix sp. HUAS TT1]|uniref:DJ-1/PfpI family protein n=1 Tax=unclassified Saccharothrix TaxID=2593673 RepID=UPI00345BE16B
MKTETVHLALYDALADWEFGFAAAQINTPQFQKAPGRYRVRTVGLTLDPVTSIGGLRITPDVALADVEPADSAMLILPGANTWEDGSNAAFAEAAGRWLAAGVPVAAICGATIGLAAEGLLNSRAHGGNVVGQLAAVPGYTGAALFSAERAVRADGLITAGAASSLEFAREVFAELDLYEPAVLEAWYGLYRTGDPTWFGKLVGAAS